MRLSVRSLRRVVKGDLAIEFGRQDLTSYGGLELVRRYLHRLDMMARVRRAVADVPSDYGGARLALLVVALFYVGARRLEHLRYLAGDRLIGRFCGLARFPTAHTVSNWLKQFTQATLAPLIQLNHDLVVEAITTLKLPRLTVDVDGTVVCTGPVGLPRLQSPSSEGPELLPAGGPSGPDRPHPPPQESPGQCPRLEAGRRLPARSHRPPPGPLRAGPAVGVPHGCGVFPARRPGPPGAPPLRLRYQDRLLALVALETVGRGGAHVAPPGARRDRL